MADPALLERVLSLPVDERLELLSRVEESLLLDSVVPSLSDAHREVLDRRLKDLEAAPDDQQSWETARDEIRASLVKP